MNVAPSDTTDRGEQELSGRKATLTVAVGPSTAAGQVTSKPAGIDCAPGCWASFDEGATVTLSATPREGWKFDHWQGDCAGNAPVVTVTMDRTKVCDAIFVPEWSNRAELVPEGQGAGGVSKAVPKDDETMFGGVCCATAGSEVSYIYCEEPGAKCCIALTQLECGGMSGVWKASAAECSAAGPSC